MKSESKQRLLLHRAPWVVPVSFPPIADGGVLTAAGRIVAVGPSPELAGEADRIIDHEGQILVPGLVNGHAHLELSGFAALARDPAGQSSMADFPAWIEALLQARTAATPPPDSSTQAARQVLAQMRADGVALVADLGNALESGNLGSRSRTEVFFWQEMLGLSRAAVAERQKELAAAPAGARYTPHSPYSTAPELLLALKERARRQQQPLSIHLAESAEEVQFLQTGQGVFRDFLERRGVWDGSFVIPGCGAVHYLDRLGLLDAGTICVHCVQVSEAEIDLLVRRQAKVCLCPGSNRYLKVGKAPVPQFLRAGLRPALGTDSAASNPVLNLWREMRLLSEDHPGLDSQEIFRMATLGGAEAIGAGPRLGSLEPGKIAALLAVHAEAGSPKAIFETLTALGEQAEVQWLE